MHPDFVNMVANIRHNIPQAYIMVTSNGGGLQKDTATMIRALRDVGLNTLAIDQYDHAPKLSQRIREECESGDWTWYEYPADPKGNPHRRHNKFFVSIMRDPSAEHSAKTPSLSNHCGAAFPKNDNGAGKRCHRPFREMSVRWDGSVAICCNDWRGEYKIGRGSIADLWQSDRMYAARQKLYHGQRDFGPCDGCDSRSYRVGLLPDKLGKESMPEPNAETDRIISEALAGDPFTAPVYRNWEINK